MNFGTGFVSGMGSGLAIGVNLGKHKIKNIVLEEIARTLKSGEVLTEEKIKEILEKL